MVVLLLLVGSAGAFFVSNSTTTKEIACTQEAKLCPDGSSVGRSGSNCEFTACPTTSQPSPTTNPTANWKTYTSPEYSITHHLDTTASKPEYRHIQLSLQYPLGWTAQSTTETPVSLTKGNNKIVIYNSDNQNSQLCDEKNGIAITSAYAKLLRVPSTFNSSPTRSYFMICAQDKGTIGYATIPTIGRIEFVLPKKYSQNDLEEMDSIISTLKTVTFSQSSN